MAGGTLLSRPSEAALPDGDAQDFERTERRFWASCDDFDVECGARVGRDEDERRERLGVHHRIERLPDGRDAAESPTGGIAYRLKTSPPCRTCGALCGPDITPTRRGPCIGCATITLANGGVLTVDAYEGAFDLAAG